MNSFAVLADPVRRRIVESLTAGEQPAGAVGAVVSKEFGIRQPAVSNQLKLLRDAGVVAAERRGSQRIYRLIPGAMDEVAAWVERYARLWPQRMDALESELVRGRRDPQSEQNPAQQGGATSPNREDPR